MVLISNNFFKFIIICLLFLLNTKLKNAENVSFYIYIDIYNAY